MISGWVGMRLPTVPPELAPIHPFTSLQCTMSDEGVESVGLSGGYVTQPLIGSCRFTRSLKLPAWVLQNVWLADYSLCFAP